MTFIPPLIFLPNIILESPKLVVNIDYKLINKHENGEISNENNRHQRPSGKDKTGRGSHNREKSTTEGGTDDQPRRPKRDFERRSGTGRYIYYI
jgi:hypothetical protein